MTHSLTGSRFDYKGSVETMLALFALFLALPQVPAQGNLVANGGFDTNAGAIKSVGQSFVSATLTVPLVLLKCDLQSVTFWHCTFGKSV